MKSSYLNLLRLMSQGVGISRQSKPLGSRFIKFQAQGKGKPCFPKSKHFPPLQGSL